MKTCTLPKEIPAPRMDHMNYNHEVVEAQETAHKAELKDHLIAMGYTGKNTGRIYSEGVADGQALYMMADAPRQSCLIHLPYGDGYRSPTVHGMTKKAIVDLLDHQDRWHAALARMAKENSR